MPGVTAGDLNSIIMTGLKTLFMKEFNNLWTVAGWRNLVTFVESMSDSEVYAWLGDLPQVREWLGARQARTLGSGDFSIKNKDWESTIGVHKNDIADNKTGGVKLRISDMAQKMAAYPEVMMWNFLLGALSSAAAPYLCYDGQGFFDTDHPAPDGGSVQANKVTVALTSANLWTGIQAMMMFRNMNNEPMGIIPNVLAVEPCLAELAIKLCESEYHADSATANISGSKNALTNFKITPMIVPQLYSTATVANANWILLCTKHPVKPVIFQVRENVTFGAQEGNSDSGFHKGMYYYGTSMRANVGAGPWFLAYGSTGAA